MNPGWLKRRFPYIVLATIGFLVYSNVLYAPFVLDDEFYIVNNPWIRTLANATDLSAMRYVADLSFALNYAVGGLDPFAFHLVNILIHILNSFLVYKLVRFIFDAPALKGIFTEGPGGAEGVEENGSVQIAIAFLTAVLFLVHPVQTQAVTYITQRYASLATFFYLGAVVLYLASRLAKDDGPHGSHVKGRLLYASAIVSAVLAMKTKEISATLPVILLLFEFLLFTERGGRRLRLTIPFLIAVAIIPLSLVAGAAGYLSASDQVMRGRKLEELQALSKYGYFLTQTRVVMTYLRLLFLPVHQSFAYAFRSSVSLFEPGVLAALFAHACLIVFAVYMLVRSYGRKVFAATLFGLGILWFYITVSIESSVVPIKDVIFEHRVYLPSIGIILSFVSGLFYANGFVRRRTGGGLTTVTLTVLVFVLIVPVLSGVTYMRNNVWRDKTTLYQDEIEKNPTVVETYLQLAYTYSREGRAPEAAILLKKAIALEPDAVDLRGLLVELYLKSGALDPAARELEAMIRLKPEYAPAYFNLGKVYAAMGRPGPARSAYKAALRLSPGNRAVLKALEDLGSGSRADGPAR